MAQPPKPSTTDNQEASLAQILEKSRLLTNRIHQHELPTIELGLDQIDAQTHNLTSKSAQGQELNTNDIRAHYFLSQGQVNTQTMMRDVGTIHLGATLKQPQPIHDTDVDTYLTGERIRTMVEIVDDCKQEILNDTDNGFDDEVRAVWKGLRERVSPNPPLEDDEPLDLSAMKLSFAKIDMPRPIA